ncbi:MAG: TIGR02281 family clan AA aspartic protease [Pseudomonadota bacterium]
MLDDPDKLASLLYLSLFGGALSIWLFASYRSRLSQALQAMAIWALIFVFAVIAYGYRDQFAEQLRPQAAVVTETGEIELRRAADGHFYAPLIVNGQKVTFLVDTGATAVVLPKSVAEDLGFDVERLRYIGRAMTANGEVRTAPISLMDVRFGEFRDLNVPASVNEGSLSDPLLGMRYLSKFRSIDIRRDRMILTR